MHHFQNTKKGGIAPALKNDFYKKFERSN